MTSPGKSNWIIFVCIVLVSFSVYVRFLYPTFIAGDSAEFSIAGHYLSPVHPTGYPLYLILLKLFTLIPAGDIAFRTNLFSAVCSAVSAGSLYMLVFLVSRSNLAGILSAFIFFMGYTVWAMSIKSEVYMLNVLFTILLTTIMLKIYHSEKEENKLLMTFCFLYGLSFGNHLSMALCFPAFIYIAFLKYGLRLFSVTRVLSAVGLFLLGFSVYLFFVVQNCLNVPIIEWNKVGSIGDFARVLTGAHFKEKMLFSGDIDFIENLSFYFKELLFQFPVVGFALGLLGTFILFKKDRKIFTFMTLLFLGNVLFYSGYDVMDIYSFFIPSYFIFSVWAGYGFLPFLQIESKRWKKTVLVSVVFACTALSYTVVPLALQYNRPVLYCSDSGYDDYDFLRHTTANLSGSPYLFAYWMRLTTMKYGQLIQEYPNDAKIITVRTYKKYADVNTVRKYVEKGDVYLASFSKRFGEFYLLEHFGFLYRIKEGDYEELLTDSSPVEPEKALYSGKNVDLVGMEYPKRVYKRQVFRIDMKWRIKKKLKEEEYVQIFLVDKNNRIVNYDIVMIPSGISYMYAGAYLKEGDYTLKGMFCTGKAFESDDMYYAPERLRNLGEVYVY